MPGRGRAIFFSDIPSQLSKIKCVLIVGQISLYYQCPVLRNKIMREIDTQVKQTSSSWIMPFLRHGYIFWQEQVCRHHQNHSHCPRQRWKTTALQSDCLCLPKQDRTIHTQYLFLNNPSQLVIPVSWCKKIRGQRSGIFSNATSSTWNHERRVIVVVVMFALRYLLPLFRKRILDFVGFTWNLE